MHAKASKVSAVLGLLLLVIASQAMAQRFDFNKSRKKNKKFDVTNLPNYDEKFIHYGFFIAPNHSTYRAEHSVTFIRQLSDTIAAPFRVRSIEPRGGAGLTVGFVFNVRAAYHFSVRLLPQVSFYQRAVDYRLVGRGGRDSLVTQLNQSTFSFIELPLMAKFNSLRRKNTRMYIIGGIKPGFEVGSVLDEIDESFLRTGRTDLSIEYGFGVEIYYERFKWAPEIRFSHGIRDVRFPDTNFYAQTLRSLTTHSVTLYFNFE